MRDKNMRDLASPDLVVDHLDLCAFTTIYQVIVTIVGNHLAGRMAIEGRYR